MILPDVTEEVEAVAETADWTRGLDWNAAVAN
jgi:hypothetical protein